MIVTTTPNVENHTIDQYLGIVAGEAIMGANIVRDILASITDIVGGRSGAYEEKLNDGRNIAMQEMKDKALRMGANAIVGVDIDYEVVANHMLMVAVSGTAVHLTPKA